MNTSLIGSMFMGNEWMEKRATRPALSGTTLQYKTNATNPRICFSEQTTDRADIKD